MRQRQVLVSGVLIALLIPAALAAAEPDCSRAEPPTGSIKVTGPQVRVGDRLIVGPGTRLEVSATDATGGTASWTPMIDGRQANGWPQSWSIGEHSAGAALADSCGRSASLPPVTFVVDAEPPAIRWEVGDRQRFLDRNRLAPDSESDRRHLRGRRGKGQPADDSWISSAGVLQIPLPWVKNSDQTFLQRAAYPVPISNEHPQAFLDAPETVASLDGSDATLGERLLWIGADDAAAGVENMTLRLKNENNRASMSTDILVVEATDHVGNTTRKEIVLRKGAR